ncbi:MAG: ABC transporter substrate-binding protein [Dehalococcoidia bacterium]|nr:ABC transporter substrate-binding protein [Dehalococcoidia bacterium]
MQSEVWDRINNRRFRRRKVLGGAAALTAGAAGAMLVGCGDDDDGGDSTPTTSGTSQSTSTATASATGTQAAAKPRGEIKMALVTLGDQSSDPHKQNAGNNLPIINSCFEQFSRMDLNGKLIPAIGSSFEESADHLTYTIKINPKAKFWDGTSVTAEDAVWSYERWQATKPVDTYGAQAAGIIDSVTSTDASTVVVKVKKPSTLRMRWAGAFAPQGWNIASKAYYDKVGEDAFRKIPMATGPYKVIANEAQAFVELEAIEGHWALQPQIAKIRMELVPEQATRIARIQTGEAAFADGVLGPQLSTLEGDSKIQVYQSEATAKATVYFHSPDQAPYNDVRFRKALGMLIDQDAIVKTLFQGKGVSAPSAHMWTIMDEYDKAKFPAQAYNVEEARKLLGEAGLSGGTKVIINSYDSSSVQLIPDTIVAVANMWKKEKIDVEIVATEAGAYFEKFRAKTVGNLATLGSGASTNGEAVLNTFYANPAGYGSPVPQALQDQIKAIGQEFDENKHKELVQAAYKKIIDEQWSITFPYSNSVWAVRKDKIKEWKTLPGNAYPGTFYTMVPA